MEETTVELTTIAQETAEAVEQAVNTPFNILCTVVCLGLLLIVTGFVLLIKQRTGNIYEEYIAPVDSNRCKLKKLLPVGLYIDENINLTKRLPKTLVQILGKRKNEARMMIIELNDARYGDYYYSIFSAEKRVYSLLVLIFTSVFGVIMCLQGDGKTGVVFSVAGIIFSVVFSFLMDSTLKKKIEKRHTMLRMEFPEFVNQLILLINAGMTVHRAWEKIVSESKKNTPLYMELKIASLNMKNGTPEAYAIEGFGRRCKVKEIMKFSSVLVSSLKKSSSEMVPVLIQQSNECWEMRKSAARELGSTAGVKMMLPMMMLFGAIILVVGFPAVMSFMQV